MFKSIESFKIAFPYFLGCRPNYTSQAVSVSSPVKICLWLYNIWLCTKIVSSHADPIHNQGLRLDLGTFRTTPVASLYVEADELLLYSRREKLSLHYAIRLAANPSNPAHEVTFPPNYVDLYEQKPKAIKSFGKRTSPLLESANIKPQNVEKHFTPNIPDWCVKQPYILLDLHSGKKSESNPHILKDDFRRLQSRYKNDQQIYTDGSREDSKVGCAVLSDNHSNMQRIPDDSSIFTAEAKAVDLALDFITLVMLTINLLYFLTRFLY